MQEALYFFKGDEMAAKVYLEKYAAKDENGNILEPDPRQMLDRIIKEFARIEKNYANSIPESTIRELLEDFRYIVCGGSVLASLGLNKPVSLSNCFVIGEVEDSIENIFKLRTEQAHLMKRRGGVGKDLSKLRPRGAKVDNAALTSTGAASFMEVDSAVTNEIAQGGRRGALMLTISSNHPDVVEFIESKQNLTKITGANISVKITDEFMQAVQKDTDFYLRFPVDLDLSKFSKDYLDIEYDKLSYIEDHTNNNKVCWIKRVRARDVWSKIVHCAWNTAEPGVMFNDIHWDKSPDSVYDEYKGVTTNPCGEIFMSAYDSCRLLHINLLSLVENPFTKEAYFNETKAKQVFYAAAKLGDDLVDLEIEAVDRIINKVESSTEESYRGVEWALWNIVKSTALNGRRCGIGFTGLADMCASLNISYDSQEGLKFVDSLMKLKLQVECQAQVDMAIERGTFKGWYNKAEFTKLPNGTFEGTNSFYKNLTKILPDSLLEAMYNFGRRNVSWSTVAPTGTVSMMTQTSSGIEPVFMPYYQRSKIASPDDKVDFIDDTGKKFTTFVVVHPGLKRWATINGYSIDTPEQIELAFKNSPYYGSTANEISPANRVKLQATIQNYITHSISSTVNLPKDTTEKEINDIYMSAYLQGCKGITVYRDGCRNGILNAVGSTNSETFPQYDAPKRPRTLQAKSFIKKAQGKSYAIVVGLLDGKPYEIFATTPVPPGFQSQEGTITKVKKLHYRWEGNSGDVLSNIGQLNTEEERACALSTSALLRHGAKLPFVIKTLQKIGSGVTAFATVLARTLAQFDTEITEIKEKCPKCGGRLVREAGCIRCLDCTHSACLLISERR